LTSAVNSKPCWVLASWLRKSMQVMYLTILLAFDAVLQTEEHLLEHLEGALAHVSPVVPPASASGAPQDAVPHSDLSGLAECIEVLVGHGLDTDGTTITCR
jgi:hypothetical protein